MKCKNCNRNNSRNTGRCAYCGSPLSSGKKGTADKAIFGVIIALFVALAVILFLLFNGSFSPKGSGGGGGGGGGSLITGQQTDPDVEIYSFDADKRDVLVGTTENVTFTSEIFTDLVLTDTDVAVYDDGGTLVGYMKDNGEDGDKKADDGIYTLSTDLVGQIKGPKIFKLKVRNAVSKPLKLYFYKLITDAEISHVRGIVDAFRLLETPDAVIEYLSADEQLESYSVSSDKKYISYRLTSGISGVWTDDSALQDNRFKGYSELLPEINYLADYSAADVAVASLNCHSVSPKTAIGVIRPFKTVSDGYNYEDFLNAAYIISKANGGNVDKYDGKKASLEVFKSFGKYGFVLVDSHGILHNPASDSWTTANVDPYIMTTANVSGDMSYSPADWQAGRIVVLKDGSIGVGAGFFDRYYSENSLEGTAFYLGTCNSMFDSSISDVLISKGAEVVYGFSDNVTYDYCNNVLHELVANQLVLGAATANTAFSSATGICGATDPENSLCRFVMQGDGNYRLVSTVGLGEITGKVTDAETGDAIENALVRIYKNGYLFATLRTDDGGVYSLECDVGDYVVTIDCGGYVSVSYNVNVAYENGSYNETALVRDGAEPEVPEEPQVPEVPSDDESELTYTIVAPTAAELEEMPDRLLPILWYTMDYDCNTDDARNFIYNNGGGLEYHQYAAYRDEIARYINSGWSGNEWNPWSKEYREQDPLGKFEFNPDSYPAPYGYWKHSADVIEWIVEGVWNGNCDAPVSNDAPYYVYEDYYITPARSNEAPRIDYDTLDVLSVTPIGNNRYEIIYHSVYEYATFGSGSAVVALKESSNGFRFWSVLSMQNGDVRDEVGENLIKNGDDLYAGDNVAVFGTIEVVTYTDNMNRTQTAVILNLDESVVCNIYDDFNGNQLSVEIDSVQLAIENYYADAYAGRHALVTGNIMFQHSQYHIRKVILTDCDMQFN